MIANQAASPVLTAVKILPEGYEPAGEIDVSKNTRLMILMNVAGLLLLVVFGSLFIAAAAYLRPEAITRVFSITANGLGGMLLFIGKLLLISMVMVLLHEGVHGIFFWLATRSRPRFGFKGLYAYASAPDWYIPRNTYAWIGLSPLVLLSGLGLVLLKFVPLALVTPLLAILIFNASGAVGDLIMVAWLLRKPAACLAQDFGDGVRLFAPRA